MAREIINPNMKVFNAVLHLGIRERVKLDIDRLVYCSHNVEELLEWLIRRGYEVKSGIYTAIKPPFGERFVRLKTIGLT